MVRDGDARLVEAEAMAASVRNTEAYRECEPADAPAGDLALARWHERLSAAVAPYESAPRVPWEEAELRAFCEALEQRLDAVDQHISDLLIPSAQRLYRGPSIQTIRLCRSLMD